MSEESERVGSGPEGNGAGVDPTAVTLALAGATPEDAREFLKKQGALIDKHCALADDQRHHLHEQLKQIHLDVWEKQLGVLLRLATLIVGLAVAGGVGLMVWDAAHSKGLLIESFTVPADLEARGLSGEVFSNLLLDKLTQLQDQTQSYRPPQSYANNWGNDIKVEIPETGVSIGEIRRFLREWLGHDTHIGGQVWHSATDLSISARASGNAGEIVTGPGSDLDSLMQKVAENVYRVTQPYRYANYLDRDDFHPGFTDIDTAEKIYRRLVTDPDPVERAWAWNGLGNLAYTAHSDANAAIAYYRSSIEAVPDFSAAHSAISWIDTNILSRPEEGLAEGQKLLVIPNVRTDPLLGDWSDMFRRSHAVLNRPDTRTGSNHDVYQRTALMALASSHDGPASRAWLHAMPPAQVHGSLADNFWSPVWVEATLEDWPAVLTSEPAMEKSYLTLYPGWDNKNFFARKLRPLLALAKAKLGDTAGAEGFAAQFPADCYDCTRTRGLIATEQKQWDRADSWFARAVRQAPSIPYAYTDWGRSLLARGKPDAAIAQFTIANEKGPHFADPLEGWGEALMARNQSHLALAKFAEAEKYAPNWGRLHLKWGEALVYAGRVDEAKAQLARAAALDLTPAEKVELARAGDNSQSQH